MGYPDLAAFAVSKKDRRTKWHQCVLSPKKDADS